MYQLIIRQDRKVASHTSQTIIGVDLGGTTISAGVVERSEIIRLKTVPVKGKENAETLFGTITDLIRDVSAGYAVDGISFGVNAPAGPGTENLFLMENLPALEDFPLKRRLTEAFGVPVMSTKAAQRELFKELADKETYSSQDVSYIMDDMQAYFERRRFMQFKTVKRILNKNTTK